jgi:transcriptional regulator with XRE-family HTH domain
MLNRALRLIRVYHDLSKTETASRVGLSKSYISELEAGNKKVSLEVLEKYSVAFGIPVSSLMLFAERTNKGDLSENARGFVAEKVLKMLDWIATISDEGKSSDD